MKQDVFKAACSTCSLNEICMPIGFSSADMEKLDTLVSSRRRIQQGEVLFTTGESFVSLYVIRSGFFKTSNSLSDGREQVTGFQMAGELIGLDGIVSERHNCIATALEDSEVCALNFSDLEEASRELPALQQHIHKIMSREIVRENGILMLLGNLTAEERLAVFLLNLTQRLKARGFSESELELRMTRTEIGSYLGLTINTISRLFSKFKAAGILDVKMRSVKILNHTQLKSIYSEKL